MATHTERDPRTREQTRTPRTPRTWTRDGRSRRRGGLGRLIWRLAVAAALVLLVGILLTWAGANPNNGLVHGSLRAGGWLATPFRDVFTNTDARERLTENWLLAAGVYLLGGRILAWAFGARMLLWHSRR